MGHRPAAVAKRAAPVNLHRAFCVAPSMADGEGIGTVIMDRVAR